MDLGLKQSKRMKVIGNIQDISTKRDSRHKNIEVYIDTVEYLTQRKDGRYYQAFSFEDELETPLVLTGDCLALTNPKKDADGDYVFKVYDLVDGEYVLNPDKTLALDWEYDFDEDLFILNSAYYSVALPNEEYKQLETQKQKEKSMKNWKGRKRS
ncbi:hypothetical protein [Rufibacter immobilis]|uniref:hypothetical protein n=1 Tax=Rufibacter immobilis TaxID=1348778 RepID=UPI0035E6A07A